MTNDNCHDDELFIILYYAIASTIELVVNTVKMSYYEYLHEFLYRYFVVLAEVVEDVRYVYEVFVFIR
jgi:hypothetical protein